MRSLEDARSEAYTVEPAHLQSWTLALEPASAANDPLLVLRPSPELAAGLFKQIFARAMESLNSPTAPSIPVVLRGEFDRVVGDQLSQEAMLAAAKAAGIEATAPSSTLPGAASHQRAGWRPPGVSGVLRRAGDRAVPAADRSRSRRAVADHVCRRSRSRLQQLAAAARQRRCRLPRARGDRTADGSLRHSGKDHRGRDHDAGWISRPALC